MNTKPSQPREEARTKVDLKKKLGNLYNASPNVVSVVQVPAMQFLMIDGAGDPNTASEYRAAVEALYGVAYSLKFMLRKGGGVDYVVMPLEGLWWTPDMKEFSVDHKERWLWTMMILQHEDVTDALFEQAKLDVQRKKAKTNPAVLPSVAKLRLEQFDEGLAVQTMHLGPYADEKPTVDRLHSFIQEQGYTFDDTRPKHHEIYLSDPRRSAPEKMKTIIRQPVLPAK